MEGNFKIHRIDEMKATVTITGTVGEWREISEALDGESIFRPTGKLKKIITELITNAESTIKADWSDEEEAA